MSQWQDISKADFNSSCFYVSSDQRQTKIFFFNYDLIALYHLSIFSKEIKRNTFWKATWRRKAVHFYFDLYVLVMGFSPNQCELWAKCSNLSAFKKAMVFWVWKNVDAWCDISTHSHISHKSLYMLRPKMIQL